MPDNDSAANSLCAGPPMATLTGERATHKCPAESYLSSKLCRGYESRELLLAQGPIASLVFNAL